MMSSLHSPSLGPVAALFSCLTIWPRALDQVSDNGAMLVALSVDDEAASQALIDKHGLQYPVGHSCRVIAVFAWVAGPPS
jgi:hypothetical protein